MLRETEQNPFVADEDKEDDQPTPQSHTRSSSLASGSAQPSRSSSPGSFFSPGSSAAIKKSKKEKDKRAKKDSKAFNLEAEKETMKSCIAESSVASTNLLNALRLINREHEQISENQTAVQQFDFCKLLRRKILRYVRKNCNERAILTFFCRSIMSTPNNGSGRSSMLTTNSSLPS